MLTSSNSPYQHHSIRNAIQDDEHHIVRVAEEGTGETYDLNLFTPALLCSKAVIYNRTGGLLTDDILKDLGMMTQAGQRLSAGRTSGPQDGAATNRTMDNRSGVSKSTPQFGHLFILFNRFQLNANTNSMLPEVKRPQL